MASLVEDRSIEGKISVPTASDTVLYGVGRYFVIICTVAGNVKVGFLDGTTLVIPVAIGLTILPWKVAQVFSTSTTATASYANLG
jgi:hypothetical protein